MAVTQKQLKDHFLKLGSDGAIYVWGANCQTITRELVDSLHKAYGSSKYNKTYYNNKLKEAAGKIGADCSGSLRPMSGYDTTAAGYYKKCVKKGRIGTLPRTKVCLVFKTDSDGDITHVGCYTGDGYVSEMASSKLNYQRKSVDGNGWDLWGMPDFVSDPNSEIVTNTTKTEVCTVELKVLKKGSKGNAVKALQMILIGYGYDCGNAGADGKFGAATEAALKAYQKAKKIAADGICGSKTWSKLLGTT